MKRFKFFAVCLFIMYSIVIVSIAFADGLPREWTEINPADYGFEMDGLTPACSGAPGTPDDEFTFFVKKGKKSGKKKLVIFFQGGGACWDTMNCIVAPTYTQFQSEKLWMFSKDNKGMGIFDQTKKNNPFKDWGFVYIPYCTGDLFWGANDHDYVVKNPDTGEEISETIQHRGFVNFQAVLKYLEKNTGKLNKVFVTGSSAGSYGATMAFPYIKEAFPKSKAYLLGDAGNGVMGGTFPFEGIYNWDVQMPNWIFPDGYNSDMTVQDMYTDIAAEYPLSQLAQYTTAFDETQIFFYNVMLNIYSPPMWNDPTKLAEEACVWHLTMLDYAYETAAVSPNYRYYIAAGTDHTVLMSPKFYTEDSAEGIPFVEWIDRMIRTPKNPMKWKNLECEDCLPAQHVPEYDFDGDGDIDGADLENFIDSFLAEDLDGFAAEFGWQLCF